MFSLTASLSYFIYSEPADMRKNFDGLSGLVHSGLKRNPLSGEVFVFINRRRDCMKLLRWEKNGFILYYKRLEKGTFELPFHDNQNGSKQIYWPQLVMMIEGISLQHIKQRKRLSVAINC